MIPDLEKVAGKYLREHATIVELSARVVGKAPPDTDSTPWVRVTQLDAQREPSSRVDHLISYLLQLDCYATEAGGQPQASLLGRTVRAALMDMPGARDDATVTATRILGHLRSPDPDLEPARERVILTVEIHAHA